jgi:protein O-mannosyl-transferase
MGVRKKKKRPASSSAGPPAAPAAAPARSSAIGVWLAAALIVVAAVAVYSNTWHVPFLFDDENAIVKNSTIRDLWPPWKVLSPPGNGETVTGRPLLNVSLAINYAIGKLDVWGYHATNLAIHLAGALLLFGIVRRTLLLPAMRQRWAAAAVPLALVIALAWAIHPLQTESVTYIAQRAESLVGLFYLLTLYCFLRGENSTKARCWYAGAVLACLLGMASKEVIVSAPLIVLLYDRAFLAGSFAEAWRKRRGFYAALCCTWLLLGYLVISAGGRGGTVGFGGGLDWWAYLCTQCGAIVHYLRLCVWPNPLVLDYGARTAHAALEIVPYAIMMGLLGAATLVALWRWPKVGVLGAWFFAILAPTSSVFPACVTQTAAEHRMYLPLAAVLTAMVLGIWWLSEEFLVPRLPVDRRRPVVLKSIGFGAIALLAVALGCKSYARNRDYRSLLSIWETTARHCPENARAQNNYGKALSENGRADEAIVHFRTAMKIESNYTDPWTNLGAELIERDELDEAVAVLQQALRIDPRCAEAYNNLAVVMAKRRQFDEAVALLQKALKIDPQCAAAFSNVGAALAQSGKYDEAEALDRKALEIDPECVNAYCNLGALMVKRGQVDKAVSLYQQALKADADSALAHHGFGLALAARGQFDEAIAHYRKALKSKPRLAEAHNDCGLALARCGRLPEAIEEFQQAIELNPKLVEAHNNFGMALLNQGQVGDALAKFRKALAINPDFADAHNNLGMALARRGRIDEAVAQFRAALKIDPRHATAKKNLAILLHNAESAPPAPKSGG